MQRPHTSHSRHQSGSNNSSRMNHYHHHHSSNQLNSSHEAAVTPPRGYHATVGPGNAGEGQPYQYEGGPLTVLPPPPAPSYHHQVCSMGHSLKSFMPYSGSFFFDVFHQRSPTQSWRKLEFFENFLEFLAKFLEFLKKYLEFF